MKTTYSINKKLNALLNAIENDLLELGIDELMRYKKEFPHETDYNIVQYGNLLIYYDDIYNLYRKCGYTSTDKYSTTEIWETYKHQVGYVTRQLIYKANN